MTFLLKQLIIKLFCATVQWLWLSSLISRSDVPRINVLKSFCQSCWSCLAIWAFDNGLGSYLVSSHYVYHPGALAFILSPFLGHFVLRPAVTTKKVSFLLAGLGLTRNCCHIVASLPIHLGSTKTSSVWSTTKNSRWSMFPGSPLSQPGPVATCKPVI